MLLVVLLLLFDVFVVILVDLVVFDMMLYCDGDWVIVMCIVLVGGVIVWIGVYYWLGW